MKYFNNLFDKNFISQEYLYNLFFPYIYSDITEDKIRLLSSKIKDQISVNLYYYNIKKKKGIIIVRKKEKVKEQYDVSWSSIDYKKLLPDSINSSLQQLISWNERFFLASTSGIAKVHLFLIGQFIKKLNPASVFEVGFGGGNKLIPLAASFADVQFGGIELSDSGYNELNKMAQGGKIPEELIQFSPFKFVCPEKIKDVQTLKGSADSISVADKSYDLVYTSQALEQMDDIREGVFAEITRVARKYVLMIEPFWDWNDKGICRRRVLSKGYFQERIDGLNQYGLEPVYVNSDLPSKYFMQVGVVLARVV